MGGMFDYTQKDYWGGPWYPYWSLMAVTLLGGLFGLDHLWLRSPLTAVLKLIVNVLTLGLWWVYDMIQVFSEKQSVMEHGLHAPLVGGLGIGKGMFRDLEPDTPTSKSPLRYLAYLVAVCFPFGFDYVIAGDLNGAFARFLTSFFAILWPIGFVWGCYNMGRAAFMPRALFETGMPRFFPFSFFMEKEGPNKLGPKDIGGEADSTCEPGGSKGFFRGLFSSFLGVFTTAISTLLNIALPGVQPAIAAGTGVVTAGATAAKAALNTTTAVIEAAKNPAVATVGTASTLVQKVPEAITAVPAIASKVSGKLDGLAKLPAMAGGGAAAAVGGGLVSDSVAFSALLAVLLPILLGGAVFGFLRLKKQIDRTRHESEPTERDDTPPKP